MSDQREVSKRRTERVDPTTGTTWDQFEKGFVMPADRKVYFLRVQRVRRGPERGRVLGFSLSRSALTLVQAVNNPGSDGVWCAIECPNMGAVLREKFGFVD